MRDWDFPGSPVADNLPYKAGDPGSIPGQGTKIPHATGQLSLHVPAPQGEEKPPRATRKTPHSPMNE